VRISADKAMVQLGADADVVLARSQLEELLVLAHRSVFHGDVVVNGSLTVLGNATVNGVGVGGSEGDECGETFLNCQEAFDAGCPAGVCVVMAMGTAVCSRARRDAGVRPYWRADARVGYSRGRSSRAYSSRTTDTNCVRTWACDLVVLWCRPLCPQVQRFPGRLHRLSPVSSVRACVLDVRPTLC
jgi:hypothetical protein